MAGVLRFIFTVVGVGFATATVLAIYESTKSGGERNIEANTRHIVIWSVIIGVLTGLLFAGILAPGPYNPYSE